MTAIPCGRLQVGADAVGKIQTLAKGSKDDKAKACAEAKVAEDMFAASLIARTQGDYSTLILWLRSPFMSVVIALLVTVLFYHMHSGFTW